MHRGRNREVVANLDEVSKRLEERELELDALIAATRTLFEETSFAQSARQVFDQACRITGATSGYVALLSADGSGNEVVFLESGGMECTVDSQLPMPIRGLRGEAYLSGETVVDNDFAKSEWTRFLPEGHVELHNVMFAPLIIDNKVVGLLGLANKKGDFGRRDQKLAGVLGEIAAIALRNRLTLDKLNDAIDKLQIQYMRLEEAKKTIEKLANTDALTGTHSRRWFDEVLRTHISRSNRHDQRLSMLMADIDHFKSINDDYGHAVGDEVLKRFGDMLITKIRKEDVVCRFGGDEFLVLLPSIDVDGAQVCAERLRQATYELNTGVVDRPITVSIGVSEYHPQETEASFRQRVDSALYAAKNGGRNRINVFSPAQ